MTRKSDGVALTPVISSDTPSIVRVSVQRPNAAWTDKVVIAPRRSKYAGAVFDRMSSGVIVGYTSPIATIRSGRGTGSGRSSTE